MSGAATLHIDIRANLSGLEKDLKRVTGSLRKVSRSFTSVGESLSKALTAPLVAAGAVALKSANDIGRAQRIIRAQTGKTGTEFKALSNDLNSIITQMAVAPEEAATALGILSTATGQTGAGLRELTSSVVALSSLTGEDLAGAAKSVGQLFNAWNVSTDKQVGTLDIFYRVSQQTGASVSALAEALRGADEVFQPLGFSLEESAALLGSFHKAGIDMQTGIDGLSRAIRGLANAGVTDLKGGLQGIFQAIKAAPTDSEAARLAVKAFGKAAGLDLADALREGKFEVDALVKAVTQGGDTLLGAEKDTRTFGDALVILANTMKVALAPLGKALADNIEKLKPAFESLGQSIANLVEWFVSLAPETQTAILKIAALAAAFGPLVAWVGAGINIFAGMIATLRTFTSALLGSQAAMAFLQTVGNGIVTVFSTIVSSVAGFVSSIASWITGISGFGAAMSTLAGVLVGVFGGALIAGGDFQLFLQGFMEFVRGFGRYVGEQFVALGNWISGVWSSLTNYLSSSWQAFVSDFAGRVNEILSAIDVFLQGFGINVPKVWQETLDTIKGLWNTFVEQFTASLESLQKRWSSFWKGFRAGIYGLGDAFGADSWKKWAVESQNAADTANDGLKKTITGFKETGAAATETTKAVVQTAKAVAETGNAGKPGLSDLGNLFGDVKKKVDETTKAVQNLKDGLADAQLAHATDKIKKNIETAAEAAGSGAAFGDSFSKLEDSLAQSYYEGASKGLDKVTKEQDAELRKAAKDRAAFEVQVYKEDVSQKQLDTDKARHEESVGFFKGLMEDAISGTRFNWEDQFKKAAVEIAAEFAARMLEANIFAADSFGSMMSQVWGALVQSVGAYFGQGGGGGAAGGGGVGSLISGAASAYSMYSSGGAAAGGATAVGSAAMADGSAGVLMSDGSVVAADSAAAGGAASGFSWAGASGGQTVAGVAGAAYLNYDAWSNWDKGGTKGKGAAIGTTVGTAIGAYFGPWGAAIGAAVGKWLGGLAGGLFSEGSNPDTLARHAAEGWFEDRLAEVAKKGTPLKIFNEFGKLQNFGANFKLDKIESFLSNSTQGDWAENFWSKFGDKGADTFTALGNAFQQLLGLDRPEVGGQLGALLAENLGTGDLNQNLDNIKLFMDAMGVSTQQLTDSLFQLAAAGNLSWQEFEVMRMSLEKIPTEGLAAFGDVGKAFQVILESGGRGIQALQGLKYVAIEAAEAGATSLEQLRAVLQGAGYDAQTLDAFFQALAQRGIHSVEELKNASDLTLAGIIADMESGGVKWEQWTNATEGMTAAVKELRSSIDGLASSIKGLPDSKTIKINKQEEDTSTTVGGATGAARGALLAFARGGVVRSPTMFPIAGGRLGLMGEAGAEAILPLRRVNGKLGVYAGGASNGQAIQINIDASGAEAGVEHKILNAMEYVKRAAVQEAVDAMTQQYRRGVY